MVFSTGFSNKKKPKSDKCQKSHLVNLYQSLYTCLAQLSSQIGPCHLIGEIIDKMINYLTNYLTSG